MYEYYTTKYVQYNAYSYILYTVQCSTAYNIDNKMHSIQMFNYFEI